MSPENPGLLIIVSDGRYDMYGAPTIMNRFRAFFLKRMGGIDESVPDGSYDFNIVRDGLRLYAELTPQR